MSITKRFKFLSTLPKVKKRKIMGGLVLCCLGDVCGDVKPHLYILIYKQKNENLDYFTTYSRVASITQQHSNSFLTIFQNIPRRFSNKIGFLVILLVLEIQQGWSWCPDVIFWYSYNMVWFDHLWIFTIFMRMKTTKMVSQILSYWIGYGSSWWSILALKPVLWSPHWAS